MYHSITFIDVDDATKRVNTWEDWHLVPSSRPVIVPPKVQTKYVDIPGADGSLDLTDYLAGRPTFANREGTIEFTVLNNYNIERYKYNWSRLYSDIMDYLHGKRKLMILEDNPHYYYKGRFSVDSWATDQHNSKITIGYNLWPYKTHTYMFMGTDFEYGEYDLNDLSRDPISANFKRFDGPKLSNAPNRSAVREKIVDNRNYMLLADFMYPNGTVISFGATSSSSYGLEIYKYGIGPATPYAYWQHIDTLGGGDTYTLGNGSMTLRFSISNGGGQAINKDSFSALADYIKIQVPDDYTPTEVL